MADKARKKAFEEIGSWRSGDEKGVANAKRLHRFKVLAHDLNKKYLEPLKKRFVAGDPEAVDEIIVVLSINAPSYRSGYRKEEYYRMLKKLNLSDRQLASVKEIALQRCASNEHRREDSELRRLMIKLADIGFLNRLAAIPSRNGSQVEKHKRWMTQVVLAGRKDLRDQLKSTQGRKP